MSIDFGDSLGLSLPAYASSGLIVVNPQGLSTLSIDDMYDFELGEEYYESNGLAAFNYIDLSIESNEHVYVNVFPNPFTDVINTNFYLFSDQLVTISMFDLRGNLVSNLYSGYLKEGMQNLNLSTSSINLGSYIIAIHSNNFQKEILISKF